MLGRLDQRIQIDAARVSGNLQRVDQILGAEVSVGSGRLARMFHTQTDQMHFTEGTEPSPQRPQSGQGAWLRDLGSDLGALCDKRISSEKCD